MTDRQQLAVLRLLDRLADGYSPWTSPEDREHLRAALEWAEARDVLLKKPITAAAAPGGQG